jgi:hypothetical protein
MRGISASARATFYGSSRAQTRSHFWRGHVDFLTALRAV